MTQELSKEKEAQTTAEPKRPAYPPEDRGREQGKKDTAPDRSGESPKKISISSATLVRFALVLSVVALLIVLAVIPGFNRSARTVTQKVENLEKRIEALQGEITSLKNEIEGIQLDIEFRKKGYLDLSIQDRQDLGDGFWIEKISLNTEMSGVILRASIINSTPMNQSSIKFDVTVGKKSQELIIDRIDPGMSSSVELYIPDIEIASAGYAKFKYKESVATTPR